MQHSCNLIDTLCTMRKLQRVGQSLPNLEIL